MARICYLDGLEIHVRTNDPRNIPHFHIWDRESDAKEKDSPFNLIWDEVLYEWNKNNFSMKVSLTQLMPDYSNIQDN